MYSHFFCKTVWEISSILNTYLRICPKAYSLHQKQCLFDYYKYHKYYTNLYIHVTLSLSLYPHHNNHYPQNFMYLHLSHMHMHLCFDQFFFFPFFVYFDILWSIDWIFTQSYQWPHDFMNTYFPKNKYDFKN